MRTQTEVAVAELLALSADTLQYYLACSPHAASPFQQVRARLPLPPTPAPPPEAVPGTVWSTRQALPCVSDVRSPRPHSATDPRPWGHSRENTGLMSLSAPLGWPADAPQIPGTHSFHLLGYPGQSYKAQPVVGVAGPREAPSRREGAVSHLGSLGRCGRGCEGHP